MRPMSTKIVFMGSPDFALPSLRALDKAFEVVGVVTQPDRPSGRGQKMSPPDVKVLAEQLGLPIIQPVRLKEPEAMAQLKAWSPDVIVVAAFGQLLREEVLNLPAFGCVNVHASLLPRWRGAAPIQAAILHDDVTGVTIMKMEKGLDTGPILSQQSCPISEDMTAGVLFEKLAGMGAELLVDTLPAYLKGEITPVPQEDDLSTYAPMLKKSDAELDFTQPADYLERMVRAYQPWPGAYQFFEDVRLKVYRAHVIEAHDVVAGGRYIVEGRPAWGTGKGLLVLDDIQAAGKNRVSGEDFLNGAKDWVKVV